MSKKVHRITVRILALPRGLSRAAALKIATRHDKKDFRGFTYNPATGRATLT